ncbi:MAG: hypothetical protein ACJ72V_05340 [Nitrososphaeraceae archaeon]
MQKTTFQSERPLLRIGSITFLTGLAIFIISSAFHTSREDPTNHLRVFAEYANSPPWISAHIGQFVGGITIFTGGFVALFRLLVQSESMTVSVLAWIGFATAIIAASTLSILQAVDGIALKRAVDSWVIAPTEEKMAAFRVAEGIRWTEIGTNSIYRIIQGTVAIVFGVAITLSHIVGRWIGAIAIFAGAVTIAAGVEVAYVGFASSNVGLGANSVIIYWIWILILGAFMWRKSMSKKVL